MNVRLLCVGGAKGPLEVPIQEYEGRAVRYWRFQAEEVDAGAGRGKKVDPDRVREAEANRLMSRLGEGSGEIVALTRFGTSLGSRKLARTMAEWGLRSIPDVTFIIGGAYGLGQKVLERSTLRLSLSTMTLPHDLARLVLVEQIYRAGTILRNEPYHKGP